MGLGGARRTGTFDHVTPGITVRYTTTGIYITGTPVPEPTLAAIASAALVGLARRRR